VAQVLRALLSALPIDHVNTMGIPADDPYAQQGEPPVWEEFRLVIADQARGWSCNPSLSGISISMWSHRIMS
jgi:L-fucose mutarotase